MEFLLSNHSLVYDLRRLKDKVANGMDKEAHQMTGNRASYIALKCSFHPHRKRLHRQLPGQRGDLHIYLQAVLIDY